MSAPEPPAPPDSLDAAARAAEDRGEWDDALRLYAVAAASVDRSAEPARAFELLRRQGVLHRERGELDAARAVLHEAAALARRAGDVGSEARALNDLGGTSLRAGDLDGARATYERTRALAARAGDARLGAILLQNLGILAAIRGDTEGALARYGEALATVRALGDARSASMILANVGRVRVDRGEWAEADAAFAEAEALAAAGGDPRTRGAIELNRAELLLKRRDWAGADRMLDRAVALLAPTGSRWRLGTAHRFRAALLREQGRTDGAAAELDRALALAREADHRLLEAEVEHERALLHLATGDNRAALAALNRAHRGFAALGARREIADLDRRLDALEEAYLAAVTAWGEAIESVDRYTAGHCRRVADYTVRLAAGAGYRGRDLAWIRMGAFLHDVGKTVVPPALLNKAGPLTDGEWAVMRAHAEAGDRIVAELDLPWDVRPMVRHHHERWDGTGYPDGLSGEAIPLTARILGVADCFDALTTPRSYRHALSRADALRTMREEAGRALDPALVDRFGGLVLAG